MPALSDFSPDPGANGSLPVQWHRYVLARARGRCECCGVAATPADPLQAHHIVRQQRIRRYTRAQGWADTDERTLRLLWHTDNGMALRESCHRLHTRQVRKVPYGCLPAAAIAWATQLGLAYELDRQYATAYAG